MFQNTEHNYANFPYTCKCHVGMKLCGYVDVSIKTCPFYKYISRKQMNTK